MSLYALGDLHLSFQTNKSMDIFGSVWKRHERKIEKYVNRIVKPGRYPGAHRRPFLGEEAARVQGGSRFHRASAGAEDPAPGKPRHVLGCEEDGAAE